MTTVVVGGGLAGALAARALELAGVEVVVLEAEAEPGGITRPIHRDGHLLEPAAGTLLLPHPALSPLLAGLDLEVGAVEPAARRRFLHHGGRTLEVRPGPGLITSPLVSTRAKLRAAAEPFIPGGGGPTDETLASFWSRRLGREAGRLAAWLMATGIHAGDPASLTVSAAFPALAELERVHGSLLRGALGRRRSGTFRPSTHLVRGGTAGVAEAVARSLGGRWRSSWQVDHLEQVGNEWRVHGPEVIGAERVVTAVAPQVLARIHPPLSPAITSAEWAPVAVVWTGLSSPRLPDGFGTLIGPGEGFLTLGFLYESSYAPYRAPAGRQLVKAIVGGATAPHAVDMGDRELSTVVARELSRVLGSRVHADWSHVIRHRPGIPQYTASRRRMVERLRDSLPPGLAVCGWAYDGVGVSQLAEAANRLTGSRESGDGGGLPLHRGDHGAHERG